MAAGKSGAGGTMRRGTVLSIMLLAAAGLLTASTASAKGPGAATGDDFSRDGSDRTEVKVSFVSLPVSAGGKTWQTAGELREPQSNGVTIVPPKLPAVVIVHGSGGVDSRGGSYARALNRAGFATLEIDLWAARGVMRPEQRPHAVAETLPDAFAALDFLSRRDGIDPKHIGIMGFSWGGVVSMLSATREGHDANAKPGQAFASHAPLYPVCWAYNHVPGYEFADLTGAPVFIQAGARDLYDAPDSCANLVAALPPAARAHVEMVAYPNAGHAWDRREADTVIKDPYSHQGRGGEVPFNYDAAVTRKSTAAVVAFFRRTLGAAGGR